MGKDPDEWAKYCEPGEASADWPRPGTYMLLIVLMVSLTVVLDRRASSDERRLSRMGDVPEGYRLAWKALKELQEGCSPFKEVRPAS